MTRQRGYWRLATRVMAFTLVAMGVTVGSRPALAAGPTLEASLSSLVVGGTVNVQGSGYPASSQTLLSVVLSGGSVEIASQSVQEVTASATGTISSSFPLLIPPNLISNPTRPATVVCPSLGGGEPAVTSVQAEAISTNGTSSTSPVVGLATGLPWITLIPEGTSESEGVSVGSQALFTQAGEPIAVAGCALDPGAAITIDWPGLSPLTGTVASDGSFQSPTFVPPTGTPVTVDVTETVPMSGGTPSTMPVAKLPVQVVGKATVVATPSTVAPGGTVTFTGSTWVPGPVYGVGYGPGTLSSGFCLTATSTGGCAAVTVASNGTFQVVWHVPTDASPGPACQWSSSGAISNQSNGCYGFYFSENLENVSFQNVALGVSVVGSSTTASAPSAPTGLTVSAVTADSVSLTWKAVASSTAYTVTESRVTSPPSFTPVATTSATTYTVQGLSPDTAYLFEVTASADGIASNPSASVSATTTASPPTLTFSGLPATSFSIAAGSPFTVSVRVEQGAQTVTDATYGQDVLSLSLLSPQGGSGGVLTGTTTGPAASGVATFTVAVSGATGTGFRLEATDETHPSVAPATSDAFTVKAPAGPTAVEVTSTTDDSVSLRWSAVTGARTYTIDAAPYSAVSASASSVFQAVGTTATTSWTVDHLQPDTGYVFYVTALVDGVSSQPSPTVLGTTAPAPPELAISAQPSSSVLFGASFSVGILAQGLPSSDTIDAKLLSAQGAPPGNASLSIETSGFCESASCVSLPASSQTVHVTLAGPAGSYMLRFSDVDGLVAPVTSQPFQLVAPARLSFVQEPPATVIVPPAGSQTSQPTVTMPSVEVAVYGSDGKLWRGTGLEVHELVLECSQNITGTACGGSGAAVVDGVATLPGFTQALEPLPPCPANGLCAPVHLWITLSSNDLPAFLAVAKSSPIELIASTVLFTSSADLAADSVWGLVLPPASGAGSNDSGFVPPFSFGRVDFYLPNDFGHLVLAGDSPSQPFCVDGTWTLKLQGPTPETLSGSGCHPPLDFGALGLAAGEYGGQLTLTAPATGTLYGTGDLVLYGPLAADSSLEGAVASPPTSTSLAAIPWQAVPDRLTVGVPTDVSVQLTSTPPLPVDYIHGVATWDPTVLSIPLLSYDGVGWFGASHVSGPGSAGFEEFLGTVPATGTAIVTMRVTCLEPGTWPVSFAGRWWTAEYYMVRSGTVGTIRVTNLPTISLQCVAPTGAVTPQVTDATIDPATGQLRVHLVGTDVGAATTAVLEDASGNQVAKALDVHADTTGAVLRLRFPDPPAGLYTLRLVSATGATVGTVANVAAPPPMPLFSVTKVDQLPQDPGFVVEHLWRISNFGSVDGTALVLFTFPAYLQEPTLDPSTLPPGTRVLKQGYDPNLGWLAWLAVPLQAGETADVGWKTVLPPSAVFGTDAPVAQGAPVPMSALLTGAVTAAQWQGLQALTSTADLLAQATTDTNATVTSALAGLSALSSEQVSTYRAAIDPTYPAMAHYLMDQAQAVVLQHVVQASQHLSGQVGQS